MVAMMIKRPGHWLCLKMQTAGIATRALAGLGSTAGSPGNFILTRWQVM